MIAIVCNSLKQDFTTPERHGGQLFHRMMSRVAEKLEPGVDTLNAALGQKPILLD